MTKHWTMLLGIALLLGSAPSARAQAGTWVNAALPFGDIDRASIGLAPAVAPSAAHPRGSVFVFAGTGNQLVAEEWDLATRIPLRKSVLGALPYPLVGVVAERAGSEIYVLVASIDDANDADVVLFTLDDSLSVRSREVIGRGIMPSVAANEHYVVTAFHERRPPRSAHPSSPNGPPPADRALHVAVRDLPTRQVVGARVFEGDELLYTSVQTERSTHAIAVDGDNATLALTGLAKILVVSVALPSLRPSTGAVSFGQLGVIEAAPVFTLPGHRVLLDAPDRRRVLASDLTVVSASSDPTVPLSQAGNGCAREIGVWGSSVTVCGGSTVGGGAAAARIAVRHGAHRVK